MVTQYLTEITFKKKGHQSYHLPILSTCCEVSQNSAIKESRENNSPFLFAMILPPESNLTLILVFQPLAIHAVNLPVLVSEIEIHFHLTHIHPSLIVVRRKKQQKHTFLLLLSLV